MADKDELERYRYIGFQVFPSKLKDFWRSPDEEKAYREKVAREKAGLAFERDDSQLFNPVLSQMERWVLMGSAILIVICFFLPWFSVTFGGRHYSVGVLGFLGALPFIGSLGAWGTGLELPALIVLSLFMFVSPIVAICFVITLARSRSMPDAYCSKIKKISKLFFISIFLCIAMLLFVAIGFPLPFGNLGVEEFRSSFTMVSFVSITRIGFYLTLAGCVVCSLMALEL